MRIAALVLLISASSAFAQAVDCEALKGTTMPYQISWRYKGNQYITQVYRDKSGDYVAWQQAVTPTSVLWVSKSTVIDGTGTESLMTTRQTGKNKSSKIKTTYTGYPKGFDRRSDIAFKASASITYADASVTESQSAVSYRFVKEERKAVGSCLLKVVLGELTSSRDDKPLPAVTTSYLPEIKGPVMVPTDADTEFDLTTRFAPLELLD